MNRRQFFKDLIKYGISGCAAIYGLGQTRKALGMMTPYIAGTSVAAGGGYTFDYVARTSVFESTASDALATTTQMDITAGDTLIAWFSWYGDDTTVDIRDSADNNQFTMEAHTRNATGGGSNCAMGLVASATDATGVTFDADLGATREYYSLVVWQFRKTGGTVAKDVYQGDTYSDAVDPYDEATTAFSTVAGATVVAGSFTSNIRNVTTGSERIAAAVPPRIESNYNGETRADSWNTIFAAAQTDITAQCSYAATVNGVIAAFSVKAT